MTTCEKGDHSEFLFCAEVTERGFKVLVPWGHSATSDIWIVKSPHRPISTQIKRAWFDPKRNAYGITVSRGCNIKLAYQAGDFDLLAAYLPDQDRFILWTFEEVRGRKRISYTPHRADRVPGNWELLEQFVAT